MSDTPPPLTGAVADRYRVACLTTVPAARRETQRPITLSRPALLETHHKRRWHRIRRSGNFEA